MVMQFHNDGVDRMLNSFYHTIPDIKRGPAWIHDIHLTFYDYIAETGKSLKVTQTEHGFFVSLDRSVVEEFGFGENRIVTLGPIEAQRVSGWEGATYIVETLDEASHFRKGPDVYAGRTAPWAGTDVMSR